MRIFLVFLMIFLFGMLLIVSNNHLELYKEEDRMVFTSLLVEWSNQIYFNMQKITGNIVKMKWVP